MKFIISLVIGIFVLNLNAQTNEKQTLTSSRIEKLTDEQLNNSAASKLTFITDKNQAEIMAKSDIQNGQPFLLLMGGIAPTILASDSQFEKEYGIYFFEVGCTGPENEIMIAYNNIIFEHLNNTKTKKWIKDVRRDVIGFKEWKKSYKRR